MPEEKARYHAHSEEKVEIWIQRRHKTVYGRKLVPGDVIEEGDVYESTNRDWVEAPCPGLTIQEGCETVFVRPDKD